MQPNHQVTHFSRNKSRHLLICASGSYFRLLATTYGPNTFAIELGGIIVWQASVSTAGNHDLPIYVTGGIKPTDMLHYRVDLVVADPGYCGSHFDACLVTSRACPSLTLYYIKPEDIDEAEQMTYEQYSAYFKALPELKFIEMEDQHSSTSTISQHSSASTISQHSSASTISQHSSTTPDPLIKVFTEPGIYTKFVVDTPVACTLDLHLAGFHVGRYEIEAGIRDVMLDPPIVYSDELVAGAYLKEGEFRAVLSKRVNSFRACKIPWSVTQPEKYEQYIRGIVV